MITSQFESELKEIEDIQTKEAKMIIKNVIHAYTAKEAKNDADRLKNLYSEFLKIQSGIVNRAKIGDYSTWFESISPSVSKALCILGYKVKRQGNGYDIIWKDLSE